MLGLPKLDRIDVNILAELQAQGRITNAQLADLVGLSASPCLARLRRLEEAGYITGYHAEVDVRRIVPVQIVFTSITLADHRRTDFARFEGAIGKIEELVECHLVSGGFDYLMKFVVSGIDHYQRLMDELLASDVGVMRYFSYIVIKSRIMKSSVPIKRLMAQGGGTI